jgi:hypothetical protein
MGVVQVDCAVTRRSVEQANSIGATPAGLLTAFVEVNESPVEVEPRFNSVSCPGYGSSRVSGRARRA